MKSSSSQPQYQKAALALQEADIVLIVTGAGFSADSGLAVYADVAKIPAYQARNLDYADLCQPRWLYKNPELFYGFWGQCFNDYRKTRPHEGYGILSRWRQDKVDQSMCNGLSDRIQRRQEQKAVEASHSEYSYQEEHTAFHVDQSTTAGAFYIFTSNVDAHFYDYFEAGEIFECHGNIELWQCAEDCEESGIWRAPVDHDFQVDLETMLAPAQTTASGMSNRDGIEERQCKEVNEGCDAKVAHVGRTTGSMFGRTEETMLKGMPPGIDQVGWLRDTSTTNEITGSNWPRCGHCRDLARPAILMFGDYRWKRDCAQQQRWENWRERILDLCKDDEQALKICIIEIGCGLNVPTCRYTSEAMVEQVLDSCGLPTLVRINPDDSSVPRNSLARQHSVSVASKGLDALRCIDELYQDLCSEDNNEASS